MITIREATKADAALIADLSRRTFYETFAPMNRKEDMDKFMNEQFTVDLLMAEVGAAGNIFLIAENDGEPAGYVRLRMNNTPPTLEDKNSIELARIYVTREMIGSGMGKRLMDECFRLAREGNYNLIWLGVWEKNERALRFYKRYGFTVFAKHTFWLGNDPQDDVLMKAAVQ